MKRLFLLFGVLAACVAARAMSLYAAANTVDSGQSYWVEADEDFNGNYGDLYLYKNGSFFAYANGGGGASASGWSTDYGTQDITYEAYSSWYDDWYNYSGNYASLSIHIQEPNHAPGIEWVHVPDSAAVWQWFNVQARGYDSDGNLTNVNVYRDGTPFAFDGGGNGYENYSDDNGFAGQGEGWVEFAAQAQDSNGYYSDPIYHYVWIYNQNGITYNSTNWPTTAYMNQSIGFSMNITNSGSRPWGSNHYISMRDWNDTDIYYPGLGGWQCGVTGDVAFYYTTPNAPGTYPYHFQALEHMVEWFGPQFTLSVNVVDRPPSNPTISSGGVTQINLGQSVSLSGTLQDPDGNLAYHNLFYLAPGGNSWTGILSGTPTGGGYSSLSTTFTPTAPGTWQFLSNGHDGYQWGSGATLTVTVVDGTAPTVPTNVTPSANTTGTSFTLSWTASSDNVSPAGSIIYEVMRDTTSLGTTVAGTTSMSVTGLAQNTTYGMKVRARDAAGNWSAWTTPVSVTTPDVSAPTVPGNLQAANNNTGTSFTLTWTASSDNVTAPAALVYEVMRDSTSLGTTAAGATSLAITGLTQATTYGMKVRARDAAGNWSAWTGVTNVTTPDVTAPSVPTGLAAPTVGNTSFTLTWTASTDNLTAQGSLLYEVMRGSTSLGTATGTSRAINTLMPGTLYAMKVRALDAGGNASAWSTVLNVTTTAVPNVDSDGDGVSDVIEAQLGTDPNNAAQTTTTANELKIHRPNP